MWPLAAPCLTSNLNLAVLNQKGQIHLSQNVFTAAPAQTLVTPTFVTPLFFNLLVSWGIFSLSSTATMLISLHLALSSLMTLMSQKLSFQSHSGLSFLTTLVRQGTISCHLLRKICLSQLHHWIPFPKKGQSPSLLWTDSSPRFPLRYHFLVCIENHLFIV